MGGGRLPPRLASPAPPALLGFDRVCTTLHQRRERLQQGQFSEATSVDVIEA